MTDLPKEIANEVKKNPFVSLKNILEDEKFDHITIGELVTAIEEKGICTVDKYNLIRTHTAGSKQWEYALNLISDYQDFITICAEQIGNIISPNPLDDIPLPNGCTDQYANNFQISDYNYYGWLEDDLPDFKATPANQIVENTEMEPLKGMAPIGACDAPNRTELMNAVDEASTRFWGKSVRKDDHSGHPSNDDVAEWLSAYRSVNKSLAQKIATIIRPAWAHKGKPPKS